MKKIFILFFFVACAATSSLFAQPIFINEVEYSTDDSSTSSDGIGIFGPVGQDLAGYSVQVVSSNGTTLTIIPLTGTIAVGVPITNRGEIWIEIPVLNVTNGNQGVILIAPNGLIQQFVSFGDINETITATVTGVGDVTSEYIGFHDGGKSLQVTGTGCEYADFVASSGNAYVNTQAPSHGNINENQVVDCIDSGASDSAVLPVELVRFSGRASGAHANLEWITAAERNNDFFTVEHSTDGEIFTEIYRTAGKGNAETLQTYTYTDTQAATGANYYRLKQTDFDGTETYFGVIQVKLSAAEGQPQVYPNPARESITVQFSAANAENTVLEIYNIFGEKVARVSVDGYAENVEIDISGLAKGTYFVIGKQDGKLIKQSFIKQ